MSEEGRGRGRLWSISEIAVILDLGFDPNDWIIPYLLDLGLEALLVPMVSDELTA